MSKKYYEAIAAVLRQAGHKPVVEQRAYIARALAEIAESDNPRFKRAQFLAASNVDDES
jgi:hypothetical protein